jgi:tetratricopeptide (TPR) repeat protein
VGATLFFSLALLFVYGCLYPVRDPDWMALREKRAFREALVRKDFERAVERWRSLVDRDKKQKREMGYFLYDSLKAFNRDDLAKAVLDELIASAKEELKAPQEDMDERAELYNEIAWYHAMRGSDLEEALIYSEQAVQWIRQQAPGGMLGRLFRALESRETESKYVNTRGWIKLLLGKKEEAMKDLKEAADLSPLGANFLYLALAHHRLGNDKEAREAARKAEAFGALLPYELKQLEELKGDLGGL